MSTLHAFINRGSDGIFHPRVNRGVKVLTTHLGGLLGPRGVRVSGTAETEYALGKPAV